MALVSSRLSEIRYTSALAVLARDFEDVKRSLFFPPLVLIDLVDLSIGIVYIYILEIRLECMCISSRNSMQRYSDNATRLPSLFGMEEIK